MRPADREASSITDVVNDIKLTVILIHASLVLYRVYRAAGICRLCKTYKRTLLDVNLQFRSPIDSKSETY